MADCLSISLVIHFPDEALLHQTLQTLFIAASKAQSSSVISDFYLTVVDHSEPPPIAKEADKSHYVLSIFSTWGNDNLQLLSRKNRGYGAGHNCAIDSRCEAYHLVINPDVVLQEDAIIECIGYMKQHPRVGMVTPWCQRADGQTEYLCKTYPSLGILLIRGFAPDAIKRVFKKQLDLYESRDQMHVPRNNVLIASGCFMFFRKQALLEVKGFCETFFLYFEDFDLSIRLTKQWQIAYVPAVKIVHFGGHSAKKGIQHILMFARSAMLFFRRHGWRLW